MSLKMSKPKNRKNYCLNNPNNQDYLSLRDELHKAFSQEEFIVEIPVTEDECIDILEKNAKSKLKKVVLNQLNYSDDKSKVARLWKIDLEKDLLGIATSSKTTECAILVLQKYESSYKLSVILIELKSSIDNEELIKIEEKFSCTMTRLYMLLILNNHLNPIQGYNEETIFIDFQGILFYKYGKFNGSNDSQLYSILQNPNKSGKLNCETILKPQDKIKIQCFEVLNDNLNYYTISLETLLSNSISDRQ